ncbi:ferredoxin [Halorientalis halophila]|uniref:ferredoxin n=1 Tax=Halorientalis halophila TaxID=3108499 RepID=UPI003008F035
MAYTVTLDREACDGIFACLVRDDRFVEAEDGLAGIESTDGETDRRPGDADGDDRLTVTFEDELIEDAREAATACPVDAIEVSSADGGKA